MYPVQANAFPGDNNIRIHVLVVARPRDSNDDNCKDPQRGSAARRMELQHQPHACVVLG